jgi:hypothetical protein
MRRILSVALAVFALGWLAGCSDDKPPTADTGGFGQAPNKGDRSKPPTPPPPPPPPKK